MGIKHTFQSTIADDPLAVSAGQVTPTRWNDDHTIDSDLDLGTHALVAPKITAKTSGGLTLEASNGTDIAIMGAANTANVTWYGSHNFDAATANTIATFGASKTLSSGGAFSETQTLNSSSAPTGTVFTGTTAPSGDVNYDLIWQQIGKRVDVSISVYYASAGSAITRQTFDLPSGLPAPLERSGFTAADIPQYVGRGYAITTTTSTYTNGNTFCGITRNSADTAYQVVHQFSSGSYRAFLLSFTYYTA